ncbi:MAG: RNA polymerase sigma factor [Oscillospiraceae bacterium]|nr:RNA polymerase sigma factor [Oscillospiraceae bacterium]
MINTSEWPTDDIEIIIRKYGDMLYRLSLIMLKNESDAEDVVQETIIKYYQKSPVFVDSEHEKAWLIKVATNKCRDLLRFRGRYIQIEEKFLEQIAEEETDYGIIEALTVLPEKYRLVLTLYYIEGYRIEDIAKIISRTSSAVKMRLQKGRKLLKEIYEKEYS